jgi:signal transduction histidine kinase
VFLNIILNARTEMQSAHGKGKFLVKTEAIDNTIRISFEDDGPGIAKKNLEKIFEPFFTTKEVGTATGLGLSICHEIIANHNGQIYARSTLGKGATFIIELPVVARQRKTATTARANANTVWR